MPRMERIYRRTHEGLRAWENQNSGLRTEYRRILALIEGDTHSDVVRTSLSRYPDKQIYDWLEELQTLGFVESESVTAERDLDFTASSTIARFLAQQKAA